MCGINGIFAYHGAASSIDRNELVRTRDHMVNRGPDAAGEWVSADNRTGFGHRRLSIIDLSQAGTQPMMSADGKLVVTFNGEIYNYRDLRHELETRGHVFQSQSDTEVLLHLYAENGAAMVHELRGMFAFGLWDQERKQLLLARDPYGIKPLYYADDGGTFRFASSVKALMAGDGVSREADPAGVMGFYVFGSVPEPFTLYRSIRALPAGTTLVVGSGGACESKCYFSIPRILRDAEDARMDAPDHDPSDAFREALLDSVRHHLVADVPVGAFLSAGVDSGSLVGLMRDAGQSQIRTVTLAFEEFLGASADEAPLAEQVARYYGTDHTTRRVGAHEFTRDLPEIIESMDQPSIDGINTWFVSKAARELGLKVAVSGVGGDELLGGYSTFETVPRRAMLIGPISRIPGVGAAFALACDAACAMGVHLHPKAAGLLRYGGSIAGAYLVQRGLFMPSEIGKVVDDADFIRDGLAKLDPLKHIENALRNGPRAPFGQVAALESSFYLRNQLLRDTDWAGMAHSLEIRTPLVDSQLLRRVAPIMAGANRPSGKSLLASAPSRPLPVEMVSRSKTGFGIPMQAWERETAPVSESGYDERTDTRLWSRCWARRVTAMHTTSMENL